MLYRQLHKWAALLHSQAGLAGALGLTFGLLLETVLLITRSNMPEPLEDRYPHLFKNA